MGTAQSLGLGREALKILEEAVLACPSILVGDDPYIDYKTFQAVLENVHTAFKHEDMSIMTRERGYKTQPVDIEEFLESTQYMDLKGSLRPIIKYELLRLFENLDAYTEITVGGAVGCITGNSMFRVFRRIEGGASRNYDIQTIYNKFHGGGKGRQKWDTSISTRTLSLCDGFLLQNEIRNVVYNGRKPVYTVTTETGKKITATEEHPFKVPVTAELVDPEGFKQLQHLRVGEFVMCRGEKPPARGKQQGVKRPFIYSIPFHPYAGRQFVYGRDYKRTHRARLVVEAAMNNMALDELIEILRFDEHQAKKLKFLTPGLQVHHRDGNPFNDILTNLVVMPKIEHDTMHGLRNIGNLRHREAQPERVVDIRSSGEQETFDISMTAPYQNYVANDFVVHNTGKSFFCEMALTYLIYMDSCLLSPQAEYGLAPGSSIFYVFQSVSMTTAKRVLFDQMAVRLARSPYFAQVYPYDKKVKTEIRFPGSVKVVPVSGAEFAGLGLNIKGMIMSECNYMQVIEDSRHAAVGETYDQAERSYTVMKQRMKSRFGNRGKVFLDSATHYPGDFLDRKFEEATHNPEIFSFRYAQWDVLPGMSSKKFLVEIGNAERNSRIVQTKEEIHPSSQVIEVPINYLSDFQRNCEAALRDFAGIVIAAKGSFITDRDALQTAITKFDALYGTPGLFAKNDIIIDSELNESAPDWNYLINQEYLSEPSLDETADFVLHLDLGISKDAAGLVVGHIQDYTEMVSTSRYAKKGSEVIPVLMDDITAPVFCLDGIMRIRPPHGGEVHMDLLRGFCFHLCQILNIKIATMDRFESTIFRQGFKRLKVRAGIVSTVTTSIPYMEWKTAYIEKRIIHPKHEIYLQEARDLQYDPKHDSIEHLKAAGGSKDLCDAAASVVHIMQHKLAKMGKTQAKNKDTRTGLQIRKIRFR